MRGALWIAFLYTLLIMTDPLFLVLLPVLVVSLARFTTQHRVLNPRGRDRYSLAYFFDPEFDTVVECLPTCQGPGNPPRYARTTWGEYLTERFDANHAYRQAQAAAAGRA